jgi:hypothetical protein
VRTLKGNDRRKDDLGRTGVMACDHVSVFNGRTIEWKSTSFILSCMVTRVECGFEQTTCTYTLKLHGYLKLLVKQVCGKQN